MDFTHAIRKFPLPNQDSPKDMKTKMRSLQARCAICGFAALLLPLTSSFSDEIGVGADSDLDGLLDSVETNTGIFESPSNTGTDPNDRDTDDDGLEDFVEVCVHFTNPNLADTDGGGVPDGQEISAGTDPLDATDDISDSDGDGVPDDQDTFPNSDLSPTIIIGNIDTGVSNELLADGSTLSDLIQATLTDEPGAVDVVAVLVAWKGEGLISGRELGGLLRAVNSP